MSDPYLGAGRKPGMIAIEPTLRMTRRAHRSAVAAAYEPEVQSLSSSAPDELSAQTQWMLAVRDQRDKQAFGLLFDHYAPRLKGVVMKGGIGAAQAEDIVQDALLKVWQRAEQFDPTRAQVSSWIYQIVRNQTVDFVRKDKRPVPEELTRAPDPEPDAADALALEQESSVLRSALQALPADQRNMIERAYLGELTHAQIQTETGLPLGTIKSRIRLALERLRHDMKGTRS